MRNENEEIYPNDLIKYYNRFYKVMAIEKSSQDKYLIGDDGKIVIAKPHEVELVDESKENMEIDFQLKKTQLEHLIDEALENEDKESFLKYAKELNKLKKTVDNRV